VERLRQEEHHILSLDRSGAYIIVLQLLREHQELGMTDLDQFKEIREWHTRNKESATIFATAK